MAGLVRCDTEPVIPTFSVDQELEYVVLEDPSKHEKLQGARTIDARLRLREHQGLAASFQLALQIATSDCGAAAIAATFAGVEGGEVTPAVVKQALGLGVKILLVKGLKPDVRGYHLAPNSDHGTLVVPVNNVLLSSEDIDQLLPKSAPEKWDQSERNGVFAIAWWLAHELSHVTASVTFCQGIIKDVQTPTKFVPFGLPLYGKTDLNPDGSINFITGERGYWLEAAMGGLLEALPSDKPGASRVFMRVNGHLKRCELPSDTITMWVSGAAEIKKIDLSSEPEATIDQQSALRLKMRGSLPFPDNWRPRPFSSVKY